MIVVNRKDLRAVKRLLLRHATVQRPEQRLWLAVLNTAISDIPPDPHPDDAIVRYFTERQFEPAAQFLDLDPDFVIESLARVNALPGFPRQEAA